MMGSVREAESLCDTGSLLAFGEGRRLGNCFLRKSEKQRSCLFPDYEESAQESTLTLIENGWNNLAERGIINRDTVLLLITLMKENAVRQYAGTKRLFFRGLRRNLCTGCIWKCFARSLGEDILKIWFGFRWKPAGTGYKKMPESL